MATDIDQDVKAAVRSLWLATEALKEIDQTGPRDGRLPSPLPPTYVHMACVRGRPQEGFYGNGTAKFLDYRLVTLTFYGARETVAAAKTQMLASYAPAAYSQLTMPSAAPVFGLWPEGLGSTEQAETKDKAAKEIWKAEVAFHIGTVR